MSLQLAEEIIKGRRLKRGEDLSFLLSALENFCAVILMETNTRRMSL